LEAGDLTLQLGLFLLGLGVLVDHLSQACGEPGKGGVDLVAVVPAPDHPEGRRPLRVVLPGLRVPLVHAHGTYR
jgi:hypothetical protein